MKYYSEAPTIPDFGYITGCSLDHRSLASDGTPNYFYSASYSEADTGVALYGNTLISMGFTSSGVLTDSDGDNYVRYNINGGQVRVYNHYSVGVLVVLDLSASASAPAVTPTPAPAMKYYPENAAIPDFGYITGHSYYDHFTETSGLVDYLYSLTASEVNTSVAQYKSVMSAQGFTYTGLQTDSDGYDYILFKKANDSVYAYVFSDGVAISFYPRSGASAPTPTPTPITMKYYPEDGTVPDFGYVTGYSVTRHSLASDGTPNYIYNMTATQSIAATNAYETVLKSLGFRYTGTYTDSDGDGYDEFIKGGVTVAVYNMSYCVWIVFYR